MRDATKQSLTIEIASLCSPEITVARNDSKTQLPATSSNFPKPQETSISSLVLRPSSVVTLLSLILVSLLTVPCSAQTLTPREIVKRSDDLMRGDTSRGRYRMTVRTPGWERTLELDACSIGRDKSFIRILSPPKEADITTLRIKTNMWNYLPNVERTIKIPPSMMLQPWMGSDFTNDDLVKESSIVYDYTHTIVAEEAVRGEAAYKIELVPRPGAAVTWGKLVLWVRKNGFVPLREEFYSEHEKLIKVLEYSQIRQMSDREIPTIWNMTSVTKEGHVTTIVVEDVVYNEPVDEHIFTMANLKNPG